jgi:hypothetical protein
VAVYWYSEGQTSDARVWGVSTGGVGEQDATVLVHTPGLSKTVEHWGVGGKQE